MKMTPAMLIIGSLLVYWASIFIMLGVPVMHQHDRPSENWVALNEEEARGEALYINNGCSYCHSLYVRVNDWGHGAERIARAGDYFGMRAILGTQRTGPDLSMEGGQRPDDWHVAHFVNPRHTSPLSLMPSWEFLGKEKINALIAYMQSWGGKHAQYRTQRQHHWKTESMKAYDRGLDSNVVWLHSQVPPAWRSMPNPYPATDAALGRGKTIYEQFCMGCHGPVGDGQGTAEPYLDPPPLDFTLLRNHLVEGKYIGGLFYYQIMNGITGTAMPYFKRMLESEKIWDVSNYIAVSFVGYSDGNIDPAGIDAAYELPYENPYFPAELDTALEVKDESR